MNKEELTCKICGKNNFEACSGKTIKVIVCKDCYYPDPESVFILKGETKTAKIWTTPKAVKKTNL